MKLYKIIFINIIMETINKELQIILGPMMSQKTTELFRILALYASMQEKVLYINSLKDTRSDKITSTHNPLCITDLNKISSIKVNNLYDIDQQLIYEHNIFGIDEGQFFEDIVLFVLDLVEKQNKKVIISSLDGSFERKKIGHVLDLIPYSNSVHKFNALCQRCMDQKIYVPAPFSHRKIINKSEILIGGSEVYEPLCRTCFLYVSHL